MFNDLALSREVLREFHNRLPETSSARKLSVMVLQRSVWPFAARKKDVDLHPFVCMLVSPFSLSSDGPRFVDAHRSLAVRYFLQAQASRTQAGVGPLPWYGDAQSAVRRWQQGLGRQSVPSCGVTPLQ